MKKERFSAEKIKSAVKNRYAELVVSDSNISSCDCEYRPVQDKMRGKLVKSAGYSDSELQQIPTQAAKNSFGCGNPLAFTGVKAGQTVLDIGSGAGIDCFIAAEKVGRTGKVIGIDMTTEMIEKASKNAKEGGYDQVEFRLGEAEAMPVDDDSVDWVISNCVINLSPNKEQVFSEIFRILKPEGHFSISDIVVGDDLPDWISSNIRAWTSCVAGAIKETQYLYGLKEAGLTNIEVESRMVYDVSMIKGFIDIENLPIPWKQIISDIEGKIWSAKIRGKKPVR
jgi:ubiquinone/menaquinone biosynthesis C-methylase UbiE